MATNQRKTRAAVKAQQGAVAATNPQTRSKVATATATATGASAEPQDTSTVKDVPKKLPPRCLACSRISGEDVRHHYTKCPNAKNNRQIQEEAQIREAQIADDVEQQTKAIMAARPFAEVPAAPPGLAHPQMRAEAANAAEAHNFAPAAPPGLAHPQVRAAAANAAAATGFAPAAPVFAQPQPGAASFNAAAAHNFAPAAPPGLAHPQMRAAAANAAAAPVFAQPQPGAASFKPAAATGFAPGAPPGLAHPQVRASSFNPAASHDFPHGASPGPAHATSSTPAGAGRMPSKTTKAPVPGESQGLFRFASRPALVGRHEASPRFVEPTAPSHNGQGGRMGPMGRVGPAPADGTTPFLGTGANTRSFAQTVNANTQGGVAPGQMPTPAQTPELASFAPPKGAAHAELSDAGARQASLQGSGFGENIPPITPVRQTYQDDRDAMQVDEMLVATPFSVAGTEDPSPCKGKGKKEKKEHGGFIPNGWKSTNGGELTPLNGLHRNTARPEKIETYAGMSHDFNPKFMAIMQKAEYMSDRLDAWIVCAALPAHGLGEVRIWENDDMARDAPDFKFALRDAIFERLHTLREQRNNEVKKENDDNRKRVQAAEAAAKEKENEVRVYRERVAKYERESKRLKKELRAREAKNKSKKQKSISRKRAFRANNVVVVTSSES